MNSTLRFLFDIIIRRCTNDAKTPSNKLHHGNKLCIFLMVKNCVYACTIKKRDRERKIERSKPLNWINGTETLIFQNLRFTPFVCRFFVRIIQFDRNFFHYQFVFYMCLLLVDSFLFFFGHKRDRNYNEMCFNNSNGKCYGAK